MFGKFTTANDRKKAHYFREYDTTVHEDALAENKVYVPIETVFTRAIIDAIADYSLCNQWD